MAITRGRMAVLGAFAVAMIAIAATMATFSDAIRAHPALSDLRWGNAVAMSDKLRGDCDTLVLGQADSRCGYHVKTSDAIAGMALRAAIAVADRNRSPDGARLRALLDLWYAGGSRRALDRAVEHLRRTAVAHESASTWNEYAAALLVRHARSPRPLDLITAIDAARRAMELDPDLPGARWNLAVALTWGGFREQQEVAWHEYRDRTRQPPPIIRLGSDPLRLSAAKAAADGQWREYARGYLWKTILPRWGSSILASDSIGSAAAAQTMATIAARSTEVDSLDSPAALLRTIRQRRGRRELRELAAGLVAIAELRTAVDRRDSIGARAALARAGSQRAFTATFGRWLRYERGTLLLLGGAFPAARDSFAALQRDETDRAPAVARRAAWGHALAEMRDGRTGVAAEEFARLIDRCSAANEEECAIAASSMLGATRITLGDHERAASALGASITSSGDDPPTMRRWAALTQLRRIAVDSMLNGAVIELDGERDALALRLDRIDIGLQTAREHAEFLLAHGSSAASGRAVAPFRSLWRDRASKHDRDEFHADLLWVSGEQARRERRGDAVALLDSAVQIAEARNNEVLAHPIRMARAQAVLDAGDSARALREFDALLMDFERRTHEQGSVFDRGRVASLATDIGFAAARMLLRRGDTERALLAAGAEPFGAPPPRWVGARDTVTVAVREVGDSVLIWHQDGGRPVASVATMSVRELTPRVSRLDSANLARLYDVVVRPWRKRGARVPVHLHLDVRGVASAIPWAALRDDSDGRYLLEQHEITFVPNPYTSARRAWQSARRAVSVVIVDAAPRDGSRRLPGAKREVASINEIWGRRARVVDAASGADAVRSAMNRGTIIHFAGHAILDRQAPERSALVLPVEGQDSLLTASQIARWAPMRANLVILAACDTRSSGRNGLGDIESLAGVFRSLGVRHVIGAAWPIDDVPTARLIGRLHAYLRDGRTVGAAVRQAQLDLLGSGDPTESTPAVWAAFQLSGG